MSGTGARPSAPGARIGVAPLSRAPRVTLTLPAHRLVIALHRSGLPVPTLAKRFPHVVNRLAACWAVPLDVIDLLDELLVDRRGGRRGFPADTLAELLALRGATMRRAAARLDAPARG
jgi:hypothetical protein